jgi:hypothetical protein
MTFNHSSQNDQAKGVGALERGDDVSVLGFAPADVLLEVGRQQAENLKIHVVERGGGKQQGTDNPTVMAGMALGRPVGRGEFRIQALPEIHRASCFATHQNMLFPG